MEEMTQEQGMVQDLAGRVAQASVEASAWKVRALSAEAALEAIRAATGDEEE